MSHYACIVVINDPVTIVPEKILERVDQEMAPFMENCCGEPDKMYMKFFDEEDDMREKYEKEGQQHIVMPDGRLLLPWDTEFGRKPGEDFLAPPKGPPPELERREIPFKEQFSTFEKFAKEWYGRPSRDETYKRYGYWQNPNAKWDWYEIGGRWAGFFQLKKGRKGGKGSQYNFSGQLEASTTHADVCFKNAVDFEAMREACEKEAIKRYDTVWEAIKDTPEAEGWEVIRAEYDFRDHKQMEAARDRYHNQPRVKAFTKLGLDIIGWMPDIVEYQIPKEQYLQKARNSAAVPFAVLKDGKWYEQGEMGWFGCAGNEKDPETWNSMVSKLMDDLPGQTILAVCDCHI